MNQIILEQICAVIQHTRDIGVSHLTTDEGDFHGGEVELDGQKFVNFALCDYLALSLDQRLKDAAKQAIDRYGVYTAISRTYMKLHIYEEAEACMRQIFGKPTLIVPRTTLGHISALPVIIDTKDAVVLDHQVHTSVRIASEMLKGGGNHVETIRHNRVDLLEERIIELSKTHHKVWYLADGIYSMYGDVLPAKELYALLDKYEQFYLYVDDAHGMGIKGEKGVGYLLSEVGYHDKLYFSTSLGKGFGSGGGALVFPDEASREKVMMCGGPLMFSSPVTPATLGAIVASAKIHMSGELTLLQQQLFDRFAHFKKVALELELPLLSDSDTPISFIAAGKPDMASELCARMRKHGYFITGGVFPAVPYSRSGVRTVVSLNQTKEQITSMLQALRIEYTSALTERGLTTEKLLEPYLRVRH